MDVELLYFDGCPNWTTADAHLKRLAAARGLRVQHRIVATAEDAQAVGLRGSPTILLDGRDPFASGEAPSLSCRIYSTPDGPAGSPTLQQLEAAIDAHLTRPAEGHAPE